MWILQTASKLYNDAATVINDYPFLSALWTAIAWFFGLFQKWLFEKLAAVWPWGIVDMSTAASFVLGHIEEGYIAALVRRNSDSSKTLTTMAYYIADHASISAVRPPAAMRVNFDKSNISAGAFVDDGNSFKFYAANSPQFIKISITRWRMWLALYRIRRLDAKRRAG